jgi:hypothetical protein
VRRSELVAKIGRLVGPRSLDLLDIKDGWPALASVATESGDYDVAIFAGAVGPTSRPNRLHIERRFQNPGQDRRIELPPNRLPLLLGLWDSDPVLPVSRPVLMAADPHHRAGLRTRYSVFAKVAELRAAAETGWAEASNGSGEIITYFIPGLLPVFVEYLASGVHLDQEVVQAAARAAGVAELASLPEPARFPLEEEATLRVRKAATMLVRDARFSRDVLNAYGGECALCGLEIPLVQGAHLYPASAPGSPDDVQNGVALCPNHHAAFDRHLIWIDPSSRSVSISPTLLAQAHANPGVRAFLDCTEPKLREPLSSRDRPVDSMFDNRYSYFSDQYSWLDR